MQTSGSNSTRTSTTSTTSTSTRAAPLIRSWTAVVSEGRQDIPGELVVPAPRGARSSPCFGEFLSMHGHYGWIKALQPIDHPDAAEHDGRIYMKASDIRRGTVLQPNMTVEFYLYADKKGLGAEDCHAAGDPAEPPVIEEIQPHKWQKSWQPWSKPWQKPWQSQSARKWERQGSWNAAAQRTWDAPRPGVLMVRPDQLLESTGASAAAPLHLVVGAAHKVESSTELQTSKIEPSMLELLESLEDDSTSAGGSDSEIVMLSEDPAPSQEIVMMKPFQLLPPQKKEIVMVKTVPPPPPPPPPGLSHAVAKAFKSKGRA